MSEMIAYCGLDCAKCEAYLLTQSGDEAGQKDLLERWRVKFQAPDMTLESLICDGCTSDKRLGGYCGMCSVRACARERQLPHCAACDDYICENLQGFLDMAGDEPRKKLEILRHTNQ